MTQHAKAAHVPDSEIRQKHNRTLRFEGRNYGSDVSFFLVDNDPGDGPVLHRHPYVETWHILEGSAHLVIGDDQLTGSAGDTVVAPANTWHKFTNTGSGVLRMFCIHSAPDMYQDEIAPEQ